MRSSGLRFWVSGFGTSFSVPGVRSSPRLKPGADRESRSEANARVGLSRYPLVSPGAHFGAVTAGSANDNKKIYKNNYEAVKQAIKNAMKKSPSIDEIIAKKETKHPFE